MLVPVLSWHRPEGEEEEALIFPLKNDGNRALGGGTLLPWWELRINAHTQGGAQEGKLWAT